MTNSCSRETRALLTNLFGLANPIYACGQILEKTDVAEDVKQFLFPDGSASLFLEGIPGRIIEIAKKIGVSAELIRTKPVFHAFPVYQEMLDEGFMVPLEIMQTEDWQISDAFGTFGYANKKTVKEAFEDFLKSLEKAWAQTHKGQILPLRWRKSFVISLQGYFHYNAIGGKSLQVPLAVAILRSFSEKLSTAHSSRKMPFGDQPVFSTGTLDLKTGNFGWVGKVDKKLEAFVREYGEGLPAVLTGAQIEDLKNNLLLEKVQLHKADNIKELLSLDQLKPALDELCQPPAPTEIDRLMELMFRLRRSIRFGDMADIIKWLRPNIKSPVYQFQLDRNLGLTAAHRGDFLTAKLLLDEAGQLINTHSQWFGISDIIDMTTAWCTVVIDACAPELAEHWLERAQAHIEQARAADRVKFWGTRCQLYRLTGEWDKAIDAGRKSVEYADMSLAGEAGQDRNYLIHALITRAKHRDETRDGDLAEAEMLLEESMNPYAPVEKRESHLGFCLHLEAEIARLKGVEFTPPEKPPWSGDWGHPWLFVLLSCARNQKKSAQRRNEYAKKLVEFSGNLRKKMKGDSLFELLDAVYDVFYHAMQEQTVDAGLKRIEVWCENIKTKGFPGWFNRLTPYIKAIRSAPGEMGPVETLCDAVFYH